MSVLGNVFVTYNLMRITLAYVSLTVPRGGTLLGVTQDCKLSWSKHIDAVVAKMGRNLSIIKRCSAMLCLLNNTIKKAGRTRSYCSVMWAGATKNNVAIGSEQGSTAGPWMYTES